MALIGRSDHDWGDLRIDGDDLREIHSVRLEFRWAGDLLCFISFCFALVVVVCFYMDAQLWWHGSSTRADQSIPDVNVTIVCSSHRLVIWCPRKELIGQVTTYRGWHARALVRSNWPALTISMNCEWRTWLLIYWATTEEESILNGYLDEWRERKTMFP